MGMRSPGGTMVAPSQKDEAAHQIKETEVELVGHAMAGRTFLLGNEGGFVLYLPTEQNVHDRTLLPVKWFGVSEFGRKYFEANLVWAVVHGERHKLDRSNQVSFEVYLDWAVRTFRIGEVTIVQSFFVPSRLDAFIMKLESDHEVGLIIEPEFDMRYYQAFNPNILGYQAEVNEPGRLWVTNRVEGPPNVGRLDFSAQIEALEGQISVELLPEKDRARLKTYLQDERRAKLIEKAYVETHVEAPDEAPIWDTYSTTIYAPARITGSTPLTLAHTFDDSLSGAEAVAEEMRGNLDALEASKREETRQRLFDGRLETARPEINTAYSQILIRFGNALVARDVTIKDGKQSIQHWSAIFAGDKYFLDAWKRDENISLIALLDTDEYGTVRTILDETWRFQDKRTGRLPHIIRLGEPLVYFSSDGTLWALRRLYQYTRQSGDTSLLNEKYGMVEHFFEASLGFTKRGLLPSGGIISKDYLWETWEDTPYTPRDGYPVEIELLWLTALENFLPEISARNSKLAARLTETLEEGRETFKLFYLDGYLADSLTYGWEQRPELTPNGYVAFGLRYPLPAELMHGMVLLGRSQLAGRRGVRSLAPRDWAKVLSPEFLADAHNIHHMSMTSVGIYNYHRGIEWLWLNQFFVEGELLCGNTDLAYWTYVAGQTYAALHESGVGGLGELYDSRGPLGADYQAWSMAGYVNSLHAFSGVQIDAIDSTLDIRPSTPKDWQFQDIRRRAGDVCFNLHHSFQGNTQTIEVYPEGDLSHYRTRLGVRIPENLNPACITIDGDAVGRDKWEIEPACVDTVDKTVWIETALKGDTRAEFTAG
ncbi:MAG: amylo-alpha-1,6-glucosidase [Chloroflexota bacterium]